MRIQRVNDNQVGNFAFYRPALPSPLPSPPPPGVLGGGDVEMHLALGKKSLQEGQLSEALHHYSAAVGESV